MALSKLKTAVEIDCLSLNSLNQNLLLSGNQFGRLFCNDVESGEVLWTAEFEHGGIGAVKFHPLQEHRLFVALGNRLMQMDSRMPTQLGNNLIANPVHEFELSKDEINSLSICPEGGVLVAGDDDGCVHVVDLGVNSKRMSIQGHENICSSVCVSPYCENEVFSGGMDCHVKSWDLDNGTAFWDQTMDALADQQLMNPPMVHEVTCPESKSWSGLMAAARGDGIIFLQLEASDDEQESALLFDNENGHTFSVACVCFAKNGEGEKLFSAGNDQKLILWNWTSETELISWQKKLPEKINALVTKYTSQNDEQIYIGSETGIYTLRIV